jgi:hypothetical protein
MLLIFTHQITNRIRYTFNLIFRDILKIDYELTTDAESFKQFQGAKISYTHKPIDDEIFFQCSNLLFETGIKKETTAIFSPKNQHDLSVDVFALSFFLACRYEEYLPFTGDKYGRFSAKQSFVCKNILNELEFAITPDVSNPNMYKGWSCKLSPLATASPSSGGQRVPALSGPSSGGRPLADIQHRDNFLQKPIINIQAKEIQKILSARYPNFPFPEKKYSYTPTIDIDNAYSYLGKGFFRTTGGFARALLTFDTDDFFRRAKVLLGKENDPYNTYDFQFAIHKKYNLNPIYFFLLGDWGKYDKNLSHTNPLMQALIKNISQNAETGIHPSFASNKNPEKIKIEKERLEKIKSSFYNEERTAVTKSRQHFLFLRFPHTYRNLIDAGITDDYTMGFADAIGFRAGLCTPYKFYDLEKEEETNLTIHPFAVMDGTLNNYLKLSPEQAIEKVKQIADEIKNVNGEFITIWHNETLSDWREWKGWKNVYEEIIKLAL